MSAVPKQRAWLVLGTVVAACGGKPAPGPVTVHDPPPKPVAATCEDVGVILRGEVEGDGAQAGPAREAAIARSCHEDRWSPGVIACAAREVDAKACLDALTDQQRTAHEARLQAWSNRYLDGYGGDAYGGGSYGGNGYGNVIGAVPQAIGVPECDAYGAALEKLTNCDKLPSVTKHALVEAFEHQQELILVVPAADRARMAPACQAAVDAIQQIQSSLGCP